MRDRSIIGLASLFAASCNLVFGIERGEPYDASSTTANSASSTGATGGTPNAGGGGTGATGGGPPTVSLDDCVLLMHMDEQSWSGADAVIDDSGLDNHGTAEGTAMTIPDGKFGRAGFFDGSLDGRVMVPDASSLHTTTAYTLSAWVYPQNPDGFRGIISKRLDQTDDAAFTLFLMTQVIADVEQTRLFSDHNFVLDRWQHLAVVFDGTAASNERLKIYVDGDLDGAGPGPSVMGPHTAPLMIGWLHTVTEPTNPLYYFIGRIDEVAIWTRALSATEVHLLASATRPL